MISDCLNFDLVVSAVNCLPKRVFFPVASSLKRVLGFYIFHSLGIKKTASWMGGLVGTKDEWLVRAVASWMGEVAATRDE